MHAFKASQKNRHRKLPVTIRRDTPIIDIFGKAKINVNLLLHLLNFKFYGKTSLTKMLTKSRTSLRKYITIVNINLLM